MSAVDANEWRSFVNHVLSVWSGYQLGVDYNSGGDETRQKHEWFIDVLAEHIYTTSGVKVDDLEEWITNILYNDFDLVLDDDSVYPTSLLLLEGYGYLKSNNRQRFDQLVNGLPSLQTIQEVKKSSGQAPMEDEDMDMDDIDEVMGENSDDDDDEETPRKPRAPRTVTDDDGWTTIVKR